MDAPRLGFLCVHGFLGHPGEFAFLEERLRVHGHAVRRIALAGHGDSPRYTLRQASGALLIEEARVEYQQFADDCMLTGIDQVVLLGHSLGGLISLVLAAEKPTHLAGVISLSAPYEHAYTFNRQHGWVTDMRLAQLVRGLRFLHQSFTGLRSPMGRDIRPWQLPGIMKGAKDLFFRLQQALPLVEVPVWLAHSPYDLTVPYVEMEKIARVLGPRATMRRLINSGHQIFPRSKDAETVTDWVLEIAESLVKQPISIT